MNADPRPLHLLHVAHNAEPHVGGVEAVVSTQTRAFAARGWRVTLLTSSWGSARGTTVEDGVRVVRIPAWHELETRFGVPFPLFSPRLAPALWREVRRADLVHIHDAHYVSSWLAALVCWLTRTPYVVHRHIILVHHSAAIVRLVQVVVLATVGRMILEGARAITPIDERLAQQTRDQVSRPERVVVIRNGVDPERFRPPEAGERERARLELGLPADLPLLLFVGRFVPKKGFAHVAAAADDRYGVVFVGGDRPDGLEDPRLTFLGSLSPQQVATAYRAVDAAVVACVGESPLAVLEALHSGVPLLANDDPALHTDWTDGDGVVFVDMAGGGLRDAAVELLGDPVTSRRMGTLGRERVLGRFSGSAQIDVLADVYDRALSGWQDAV